MVAAPNDDLQGRQAAAGPIPRWIGKANDVADQMAAKGSELAARSTEPLQVTPGGGISSLTVAPEGTLVAHHPIAGGIEKGIARTAGGMVADPRNWVIAGGMAGAGPVLARIISGGFALQMGSGAVNTARDLVANWDKYSPAERAEKITEGGLTAAFAVGSASHALSPDLAHATASASLLKQKELMAQRQVRGLPPVDLPPEPVPTPIPEVPQKDVADVGKKIASLPKENRAQAIIQAHGELAKDLLQQGKVVTPDGQLHIVKTQDQADTLAAKVVNDEISRVTKQEEKPAGDNGEAMGKGRMAARAVVAAKEKASAAKPSEPGPVAPAEGSGNEFLPSEASDQAASVADGGVQAKPAEMAGEPTDRTGTGAETVDDALTPRPFEFIPEQTKTAYSKGDKVSIEGIDSPAEVRYMSDASGLKVLSVEFAEPTKVPWSAKPVTKTSVPTKYQGKVSAFEEKADVSVEQGKPAGEAAGTPKVSEGAGVPAGVDVGAKGEGKGTDTAVEQGGESGKQAAELNVKPLSVHDAERKEPWQMTASEWGKEFDKTKADWTGGQDTGGAAGMGRSTSEKGLGNRAKANFARQDFLKMGLKDRDVEGLKIPARHADVIAEAVKQGKPVPAEVLADYPDLKPTQKASELTQPAKSEWQQAYDKAVAAHPERESEFRKMSGEQLKAVPESGASITKGQFSAKDLEAGEPVPAKKSVPESAPVASPKSGGGEEGKAAKEPESILAGESGSLEPGKLGEAAVKEYEKEIHPALVKAGTTLKGAFSELQHLIAPRAGVPIKTLDSVMELTGAREQHRFVVEQTLEKFGTAFDKLGKDAGVEFVDKYKQGQEQPTLKVPENKAQEVWRKLNRKEQATAPLQQLADFMHKTDDATYRNVVEAQVANLEPKTQKFWKSMSEKDKTDFLQKIQQYKADDKLPDGPLKDLADHLLSYKDDHYRVLWKTIPGKAEAKGAMGVRGVRPLEGSKGFLKQSTLDTMSEGLERGGEPVSYNPVRMFELAQADAHRYITAQGMWQDALDQGGRVFVKQGSPLPDGFKFVEDRIGNVRFQAASGEGSIQAGRWALREDYHRLLSNMLGHDLIRESTIGNGLMSVKNNLTAYRLSLSPFHALTTTVSSWSGGVAHGLQEVGYGVRKFSPAAVVQGVKDVVASPLAPYLDTRLGTDIVHYVTSPEEFLKTHRGEDFIQRYPEAAQMVGDLFSAGAKLGLHEDERIHGLDGFRQAVAEDRYLAALVKAPFAVNQQIMRPLFGYYIPRVKLATFFRDHAFELKDRAADVAENAKTPGELARKTWDTTENVYGQMNWDARFWKPTFKSAVQLGFRAFTWFAGNVRLVKDAGIGQTREVWESAKWWNEHMGGDAKPLPSSGAIPRIDPAFAKIVALSTVYMGANAAIQYAMTQELPKDATDLFAARIGGVDNNGKPLRVVAPAIVLKDALSLWGQGATGYLRNKVADWISGLSDVINNEDFRHTMIHNPHDSEWKQRYDDAAHILGSPIGISTYMRATKAGESNAKGSLGLAGFSPAPAWMNQSPLDKEISKIQGEAGKSQLTQEQRADIDLKHSLIGALRNHNDKPLSEAIADKQITLPEAANLRKRARLDPLEDRINGLRFMQADKGAYAQLVRLSNVKGITPREKQIIERLKAKKRDAMFRKGESDQVKAAEAEY
jgi:hypothetical protein